MTPNQKVYLAYIRCNPGRTAAQVLRACNPLGGRDAYGLRLIRELKKSGLVKVDREGRGALLFGYDVPALDPGKDCR